MTLCMGRLIDIPPLVDPVGRRDPRDRPRRSTNLLIRSAPVGPGGDCRLPDGLSVSASQPSIPNARTGK